MGGGRMGGGRMEEGWVEWSGEEQTMKIVVACCQLVCFSRVMSFP